MIFLLSRFMIKSVTYFAFIFSEAWNGHKSINRKHLKCANMGHVARVCVGPTASILRQNSPSITVMKQVRFNTVQRVLSFVTRVH